MNRDQESALKEASESVTAPSRNSGNLDVAIKAVYRRYGTDLPSFFRDAYEEVARQRRESAEGKVKV